VEAVGSGVSDDDRKIVEAIRGGDTEAFNCLYHRHFRRIYNFAIRKLGDPAEAEDVTQEVFTAVFSCLDRFQGRSDLVVWIYGICRNILNNRLRRRGGVRLISLEELPPDLGPVDQGPLSRAEARQTLSRVQAAIEELPSDQRRILELRHAERLAIRRIAEIMERSEDAVKSSLYRARRTLAAKLPEETVDLRS
jgi:RNA polymerase sigma-70 factor (ECF subfamily)